MHSRWLALLACFRLQAVPNDVHGLPYCCTGRHASVLNVIVAQLPPEHPAFETVQLQETLGHTPFEVVMGAAVGLVIGAVVTGLWGLVAG